VLAYGGMAERTKRAAVTEEFLTGKPWTRETVEQAMPLIAKDFTPISDARASAEYRIAVAKNLLMKFLTETSNR
jgi:xanthine dehydrogenase small subunit